MISPLHRLCGHWSSILQCCSASSASSSEEASPRGQHLSLPSFLPPSPPVVSSTFSALHLYCTHRKEINGLFFHLPPSFSSFFSLSLLPPSPLSLPPQTQKVPHRLLIIGTTGFNNEVLELTGIQGAFDSCIEVPSLTSGAEIMAAIKVLTILLLRLVTMATP